MSGDAGDLGRSCPFAPSPGEHLITPASAAPPLLGGLHLGPHAVAQAASLPRGEPQICCPRAARPPPLISLPQLGLRVCCREGLWTRPFLPLFRGRAGAQASLQILLLWLRDDAVTSTEWRGDSPIQGSVKFWTGVECLDPSLLTSEPPPESRTSCLTLAHKSSRNKCPDKRSCRSRSPSFKLQLLLTGRL